MRKGEATILPAKKPAAAGRSDASVQLVCLALALSLVVLAGRIFSAW